MMNLNFKEKSNYVEGLALEYNKALIAIENESGAKYLESLREDVETYRVSDEKLRMYKTFKRLIDSILDKLNYQDKLILCNDYFFKKNSQWWIDSYSRSSYYRGKHKALNAFFNYFMN